VKIGFSNNILHHGVSERDLHVVCTKQGRYGLIGNGFKVYGTAQLIVSPH